MAHFFLADLCTYAHMIWPRTAKFGRVTRTGGAFLVESKECILSQGGHRPMPPNFGACYTLSRGAACNNQIFRGYQTRWEEICLGLTSDHAVALAKKKLTQMVMRDLIVVANLIVNSLLLESAFSVSISKVFRQKPLGWGHTP